MLEHEAAKARLYFAKSGRDALRFPTRNASMRKKAVSILIRWVLSPKLPYLQSMFYWLAGIQQLDLTRIYEAKARFGKSITRVE